jgi:acetyltransferase-like isoleucine patch superfamily enzyme
MLFSRMLFRLYKVNRPRVRDLVLNLVRRMERGDIYSPTLRDIFRVYHEVSIGLYSLGGCFKRNAMDRHTTIGRFCSIASGVRAMNRNHPMSFKSMHAFFYNPRLGYTEKDLVEYTPLVIGSDVWIGSNALILPGVRSIGHGAVIAAGAVVNKQIPPYAVVVGNPARVVRYRFSPPVIEKLLASCWWERPIEEIRQDLGDFTRQYEAAPAGGPESVG